MVVGLMVVGTGVVVELVVVGTGVVVESLHSVAVEAPSPAVYIPAGQTVGLDVPINGQ